MQQNAAALAMRASPGVAERQVNPDAAECRELKRTHERPTKSQPSNLHSIVLHVALIEC